MQKRIITLLMIVVGASLGISLLPMAWKMANQAGNNWLNNNFTNGLIGAIIFFILSLGLAKYIVSGVKKIETALNELSLTYLLFGTIGAILGLTFGVIISIPMYNLAIPIVNSVLPILVMIMLGYLGFRMGTTRIDEWRKIFVPRQKKMSAEGEEAEGQLLDRKVEDHFHKYKILDTSVIIDGRIYDIAKSGF